MLSLKGDIRGAEQSYGTSLEWAGCSRQNSEALRRRHKPRTPLARRGKHSGRATAGSGLRLVYGRVQQRDLKEAKALLEELRAAKPFCFRMRAKTVVVHHNS